jgi:hypothetical protein
MPKITMFETRMIALIQKINMHKINFEELTLELFSLQKSYGWDRSSYPEDHIGEYLDKHPLLAYDVFVATYDSLPEEFRQELKEKVLACVTAERL